MIKPGYKIWLFIAVIFFSAVYFFIFSQSGLIKRVTLRSNMMELNQRIENLRDEKKYLQKQLDKNRKGEITDNDLQKSGYVKKGERIVIFKNDGAGDFPERTAEAPDKSADYNLTIYRIMWVSLSVLVIVLLVYFGRGRIRRES